MARTEEQHYRLSSSTLSHTNLPPITEHPLMKATGTTLRQARRAHEAGRLRCKKPGLYVLTTDSAIREWINGSPEDE